MKEGERRRGKWGVSFTKMGKIEEEEIWREGQEFGFGQAKFRILLDIPVEFLGRQLDV